MCEYNLGISILNYKTWEKTVECVDSILDNYPENILIVVVDNHSPNESYEQLHKTFQKEKYRSVELIQTEFNGGFSSGNNVGVRYLKKKNIDYCIVTNNDVILKKNSIEELFLPLFDDNNILMVTPKILDTDGRVTCKAFTYKQTLKEWIFGRPDDKVPAVSEDSITKVYSFSGCCFAINLSNFSAIEYFDENVFLYCEEAIVSEKAQRAGLDIIYNPKAIITHNHGSTTGQNSLFTDREFLKSLLYYFCAYEDMRVSLFFMWFIMIFKFTLKMIMGKYPTRKGYGACVKETFSICWHLIWKGEKYNKSI